MNERRHAKLLRIEERAKVLVKRLMKASGLSPNLGPKVCTVTCRNGGEFRVVSDESGKVFKRKLSHVQRDTSTATSKAATTLTRIADDSSNGTSRLTTASTSEQAKIQKRSAEDKLFT